MIDVIPDLYFVRGVPFTTTAFLPEGVPDGYLTGWTLKSQLRKYQDNTIIGLIADLEAEWEDPDIAKQINLFYEDTSEWPIAIAEFDILVIASNGQAIRTEKVVLDIKPGVTKYGN